MVALACIALAFPGCGARTLESGKPGTDAGTHADAGNPFAHCTVPPPSTCSLEDTCKNLACGGLEFQEDGCQRATCSGDADCGADERCTAIECVNTATCAYDRTRACSCEGDFLCTSGAFCNPTSAVGPRGDWRSITVQTGGGPCPPGEICTSSWKITPDGAVVTSKSGQPGSAMLDGVDLADLRNIVMGPDLRLALRDGIPCDPPPTDVGVTIVLELSTVTLQRDVTGCVLTGPTGNVFQRVDQIATRY